VSQRTERLDELLREEISRIISREVQDPRVGFVTVTSVEVASDLRHATVWVSIIGQPDERKETFRALGRAMPFVRRQLRVLRIKRIPELHLKVDDTAERGTRVLQILQELEGGGEEVEVPKVAETLPTPVKQVVPELDEEIGLEDVVPADPGALPPGTKPRPRRYLSTARGRAQKRGQGAGRKRA
jgi:ribosome-binding factor A